MNIAIIGAGAAGYFAAINIKELAPHHQVTIFESSSHSLSKVKVSGGGRCNLTNTFAEIKQLSKAYPRGDKLIKRVFQTLDYQATYKWFEDHGVELTIQDDQCIFPKSQDSGQIIDCFEKLAKENQITVKHSYKTELITPTYGGYKLSFADSKLQDRQFDAVIVALGGKPQIEGFDIFKNLDLKIESPVPSLFSFNIPNDPITELMGTVVENVKISITKSKLSAHGTILITHWGMSGPAVLKLSSYAARLLKERDYNSTISINWCPDLSPEQILEKLNNTFNTHSNKQLSSIKLFNLPQRLAQALITKSGISPQRRCAEVGSKGKNKLVNTLSNDEYLLSGQSRFKDEFVTCGGISLSEIDLQNCEARKYKNLYFAGEILDVDAITGGFNLQAAWSTAYAIANDFTQK